jgi:hypothetical protein
MSISEFVQIFLSICGGVSIVGGAAAVIFKWITPAFRLNKRVETLEEHDKRDYESLQRIAERDSLILEVLSTMLDSQISGNNVEELKKQNRSLQIILHRISVSISKGYAHEIICVHKERYRQVLGRVQFYTG